MPFRPEGLDVLCIVVKRISAILEGCYLERARSCRPPHSLYLRRALHPMFQVPRDYVSRKCFSRHGCIIRSAFHLGIRQRTYKEEEKPTVQVHYDHVRAVPPYGVESLRQV